MIYIVMGKSIGSGNSTISSQILIPYVYKKTNNPEILYHLSDKSSN